MIELVEKMLGGDRQSLARLITVVETGGAEVAEVMKRAYPYTGRAYCIGVTGPPGGGKSTLVDKLTSLIRKEGLSVGIIATDPTSPFSGGAVLGDRIRMQQHYLDEGVFIRSMTTGDSQGGLSKAARSVIKLLDAFGKDIILVETVGVGQTELDIMEAVDTIIVVLVPEAGDSVQTLKAGLLEIADIFAVNKADRPGAMHLVAELEAMLHWSSRQSWWQVPVIATQAINNIGTEELYQAIKKHRHALEESGRFASRRCQQRRAEFLQIIEQRIMAHLIESAKKDGRLSSYLERVEKGEVDPYSVANKILSEPALIEGWLEQLRKV